nr:zinc finger protein CONSTANS-LIKE 16-like [Coffea arabica]
MMITEGKTANVLGGKTARACDSCLKKRARWFCAADDAFLCQACDTSVHSANQLASRHERIRLATSSFMPIETKGDENSLPTWHQGFTRKARTPRNNKASLVHQPKDEEKMAKANPLPLVPEISGDETSPDESEEQHLFCRVPVFDPFAAELCSELSDEVQNIQADKGTHDEILTSNELNVLLNDDQDLDIPELIASDAELAEFAADVESLLGTGLDEDSCDMEDPGMMVCKEEDDVVDVSFEDEVVKVEDEDDQEVQAVIACHLDPALDMARESLNWDFDSSSPVIEEEEELKVTKDMPDKDIKSKEEERRMMHLKLNYEEVITAWASQGSPWADGTKPELNLGDCWPDFMGMSLNELHHPNGAGGGRVSSRDEEREARVTRYREKRRTRLFSKKIRYEVRKLNAEKRPRMKGRFVKRTSFAGPSFPYLMKK